MQRALSGHIALELCALAATREAKVEVWHQGGTRAQMRRWLGRLPVYRPQPEGSLGARLCSVMRSAFKRGAERCVIVASDCPDMTADHIREALALLGRKGLALGPASDGGYWLVGLSAEGAAKALPRIFEGIEWGSERVLRQTIERASALGLEPVLLDTLADIDRPEDLVHWERCQGRARVDAEGLDGGPDPQRGEPDRGGGSRRPCARSLGGHCGRWRQRGWDKASCCPGGCPGRRGSPRKGAAVERRSCGRSGRCFPLSSCGYATSATGSRPDPRSPGDAPGRRGGLHISRGRGGPYRTSDDRGGKLAASSFGASLRRSGALSPTPGVSGSRRLSGLARDGGLGACQAASSPGAGHDPPRAGAELGRIIYRPWILACKRRERRGHRGLSAGRRCLAVGRVASLHRPSTRMSLTSGHEGVKKTVQEALLAALWWYARAGCSSR